MKPPQNTQVYDSAGSTFWFNENGIVCFVTKNTPSQTLEDIIKSFNKFKEIIGTINSLDLTKAAAFAILGPSASSAPSSSQIQYQTKTPTGSSINSPSAPQNKMQPESDGTTSSAKTPQAAPGSGIETPASSSDINNLISYQSSLIAQLVSSVKDLLTVNKDILKYTRQNQ